MQLRPKRALEGAIESCSKRLKLTVQEAVPEQVHPLIMRSCVPERHPLNHRVH